MEHAGRSNASKMTRRFMPRESRHQFCQTRKELPEGQILLGLHHSALCESQSSAPN
jgi:hypothetical protein